MKLSFTYCYSSGGGDAAVQARVGDSSVPVDPYELLTTNTRHKANQPLHSLYYLSNPKIVAR
jgi:hypothetical protein